MDFVMWALQILLAIFYMVHGVRYISPPTRMIEQMKKTGQWVDPPWFRQFIGGAEVLAAVGLVLPGLTGILPWLTLLATTGLMVVMIGAMGLHVLRRERPNVIFTGILLALLMFLAYMRWQIVPLW